MNDLNLTLSPDRPLTDPEQDKLGYKTFAEMLAKSIVRMSPPDGMVIAIHGEWGTGKSTVIEFICTNLRKMAEDGVEIPTIVRFNPWMFSSRDDLVRSYLNQLANTLGTKKEAEWLGKAVENIRKLADVVAEAEGNWGYIKPLAHLIRDPRRRDINAIRANIIDSLERAHAPILVIMDDIDRLTGDEVRQLFTAIKAIANFPNVIYLTAFDDVVVTQLLDRLEVDGKRYLEKIVQASFRLPTIDSSSLLLLFQSLVEGIVGELPPKREYVDIPGINRIDDVISLIRTPRDIFRISNALAVSYPVVAENVDKEDFIQIESLRILFPEVYDILRNSERIIFGSKDDERNALIDKLKKYARDPDDEYDSLNRIVSSLFPQLRLGSSAGYGFPDEYLARHRICIAKYFKLYFRFELPINSLSTSEEKSLVEGTVDEDTFAELLRFYFKEVSLEKTWNLLYFFDRIVVRELPSERIPFLVKVFFSAADTFFKVRDSTTQFGRGHKNIQDLIVSLVTKLLLRLGSSARVQAFLQAMKTNGVHMLTLSTYNSLKFTEQDRIRVPSFYQYEPFTDQDWESISDEVDTHIKSIVENPNFIDSDDVQTVLMTWNRVKPDSLRMWYEARSSDPLFIAKLVRHFLESDGSELVLNRKKIELLGNLEDMKATLQRSNAIEMNEDDQNLIQRVIEKVDDALGQTTISS